MPYGFLVTLHLLCAVTFIGIVTFEVLFLEPIRKRLPATSMALLEEGIHTRARRFMPFVVATLFISGITMVVIAHADALHMALTHPLSSPLGTLLGLKIVLATSVLVHFVLAMKHSICGTMTSKRFLITHWSVFLHMVGIVVLAKAMYYVSW